MKEDHILQLRQGLETAFVNQYSASNLAFKPQFISNNPKDGSKVISSIESELLSCDSFSISVAFITEGGITPLLQTLKELEKRNVSGKILTTDYLNFSEPKALRKLAELKNIELKMFVTNGQKEGFHTKGYIFRKEEMYRIIVGSSNMTSKALTVNHEWNTKIISTEDGEYTNHILAEFEELWNSKKALNYEDFIEQYEEVYIKNKIIQKQKELVRQSELPSLEAYKLQPNSMQIGFIHNLEKIYDAGEEKALLISATGTGKTFASAFAMREMRFEKVLFLVHRNQIAKQAMKSFCKVFNGTKTMGLVSGKYQQYDADFVFATIQTIGKDENLQRYTRDHFSCIIIDECHRSVFGEMLSTIKFTFPGAIFFGFSGTPILEINKKKDSTTADVFGDELEGARYTVADGMRDHNVLGFDSIPQPTYKDKDLREEVALEKSRSKTPEEAMADEKRKEVYLHWMQDVPMGEELDGEGDALESIEGAFSESLYTCDKHRNAVIDDILDNWTSQSLGGKYHAILACSRIPEAIAYYKLFKARNTGLKITAVFDPSDGNNEGSIEKIDGIHEILMDYKEMYGTEYGISNYGAFKKDVCARLAHKEPYLAVENDKAKCLDILIVVDQMLTGYDSKWLNTLYMDKTYKWSNIEMIIQAFSRTNRVFQSDKKHGIIRYYRRPYTMKNIIEYAFKSYSGDKPYGIFVLKLKANLEKMNEAFSDIKSVFDIAGVHDFSRLPEDKDEIKKFSNLFRKLNNYLESARVQGFVWEKDEYEFEDGNVKMLFDKVLYETLLIRYKEIKRGGSNGGDDVGYDIDPYLMSLPTDKIDSDYMNSRFHKYYKLVNEGADEEKKSAMLNELHKSFATLTQEEQKYAHMVIRDIQNSKLTYDEDKTIMDYISSYVSKAKNDEITVFVEKIGINEDALRRFLAYHVNISNIDEYGRFEKLKQEVNLDIAQKYFEDKEGKPIPRRKIHPKIDKVLREFILFGIFEG